MNAKSATEAKNAASKTPAVAHESIYDHPKYYDLVFGADCAAEREFILQATERYCRTARVRRGQPPRFFEPACGTGRLLDSLSRAGHDVAGLDLNARAVEFCNARFKRRGLDEPAFVADMSKFEISRRFDVGFNTINSFRHLSSEKAAREHLRCMGQSTTKGGIYLLGIHLTPTEVPPSETESWSARRGHLSINTHMWFVHRDTRKRVERFGIYFDIHKPSGTTRIVDELVLRSYTPAQMNRLIASSEMWETVETFDFGYDIDEAIEVDGSVEDVVYVLRRR